jgi:hypothetical protein
MTPSYIGLKFFRVCLNRALSASFLFILEDLASREERAGPPLRPKHHGLGVPLRQPVGTCQCGVHMRGIGTKPESQPQVPSIRIPTIAMSTPLLMFLNSGCGGAEMRRVGLRE